MKFTVVVIRTVGEYATKKAASAALKKLKSKDGEIAVVLEKEKK